ncbi:MAG: type II toxin-antitoxin system HigB family toxin [Proteobacteria bacterium]|nr:type II toxin-antitoxin system HigB family toxin [Pseudomonadota bacterium]
MRIIAPRTLRSFWESGHADSEGALRAWLAEAQVASWGSMADIKVHYPGASIIDSERVVFNIRGNNYRLFGKVWFPGRMVFIKFIGTHAAYDRLDVTQL